MKILNYLCVLIGLFVSCSKDGKLNSGTNPGKNAGDTIQCISATEITEYYIHYCGGDSGSVGELMQITQGPSLGIHTTINGTFYNNVVWISFYPDTLETIPDSLRIPGEKLYFNYMVPVKPVIWNGPCIASTLVYINYPLIFLKNLSTHPCL